MIRYGGACSRTDHYYGGLTYDLFTTELLGVESGKIVTVSPGAYKFDVEFRLPFNIPYSTNFGYYGKIDYKIVATLLRRNEVIRTVEKPFSVIQKEDLNLYPEFLGPIHESHDLQNGLITLNVSLFKSGFGVNEIMPLRIDVTNKTQNRVLHMKYTLQRFYRFKYTQVHSGEHILEQILIASLVVGKRQRRLVLGRVSRECHRT